MFDIFLTTFLLFPVAPIDTPEVAAHSYGSWALTYQGDARRRPDFVVRETDKYRLQVPRVRRLPDRLRTLRSPAGWYLERSGVVPLRDRFDVDELERLLCSGFDRVENDFGPFTSQIHVYVVDDLYRRNLPLRRPVGMQWREGGQIRIAVAAERFNDVHGTHIHELVHARLREKGTQIPLWLEEGICHVWQAPDGVHPGCRNHLARMARTPRYDRLGKNGVNWNGRAMGWALVYYWVHQEGKTADEVLALAAQSPDSWPCPDLVRTFALLERG